VDETRTDRYGVPLMKIDYHTSWRATDYLAAEMKQGNV